MITKCKKCNNPFSFTLLFKSFWSGYIDLNCTNCQTNHTFSLQDRLIGGAVIGISIFITGLLMNYFQEGLASKLLVGLPLMIISSITFSALSMSLMKLRLRKKPTTENNI
ncbi:MAG: hypothetical protein GVX78_01695 [Bacteroidetes bacterium]|nr:hypothetical protein [Bacteroidota bacterium]